MGVELGFSGEVADFYHRYRHGYPAAVIDALIDAFGLNGQDVVVDLGCGTGQLTLPPARRGRGVGGVDPQPAMLRRAPQAPKDLGVPQAGWVLGARTAIPALPWLLGGRSARAG